MFLYQSCFHIQKYPSLHNTTTSNIMKFNAAVLTSLLSLSALATAYPSAYAEPEANTFDVRSADAYAEALDNVHNHYRRQLDSRDLLIRDLLERAITGWHDPKTLSGGKSKPKKEANAAKKKGYEGQASDWADKNGYSHVTIQ